MALQEYLNNAMTARRNGVLKNSDQLTLGVLIQKLEPMMKDQEVIKEKYGHYSNVVYDFEYLFPTAIDSWRGSYSELALNFESDGDAMELPKFLEMLKETVGKEFTGYKGGEFKMSKQTPIWIANYSHSGRTALIDAVFNEYEVILMTAYREF